MLVPGLPITDLAVETVVANSRRSGAAAASVVQVTPAAFRDAVRTWQARILFGACYAFVVGLVVMAG